MGTNTARRIRLTAALLLVLIPLAFAYLLPVGPRPDNLREFIVITGTMLGLILAYILARSPYPTPSGWLVVLLPWLAISIAWQSSSTAPNISIMYFGLVPIILAGLVLNLRAAIGFAAFNILGAAFVTLRPDAAGVQADSGALQSALFFLVTATPLVLLGAGFLERSARQTEQANQRLREAERYRLELLNVIAHDLASPLTPVQLQMHVLKAKVGDTKGFGILQRNINHLQRLVGDVRDLSRIEMDRLQLDRRETDLATLVHQTAEGFAQTATERRITPDIQADAALPVHADPDRLNQVLYNLMTNALKFSPDGSTIRINATRNNGHARVIVQDQGRGLAPADIPRLFQPFSQVHDRNQYEEKGTGLGLYIAKGIIEGHGGRIWAESEGLGHGATFAFEIPVLPHTGS